MPWEMYLALALIPGLFAGLLVAIAKIGGWSRLAQTFPAGVEPDDGICFRGQFLGIGWCDYNGCVRIRVCVAGIYLAVSPIIVGHAPVLLPWSAMRFVEERRRRFLSVAFIEVGQPTIARLRLPLRVIDAARELPSSFGAGD